MCTARRRGKQSRVLRSSLLIFEGDTQLLEVCLRWSHEGWDLPLSAHRDIPHGKQVLPFHPPGFWSSQAPSLASSLPAAVNPAAWQAHEWCTSGDCHLVGNQTKSVHGRPQRQQPRGARKTLGTVNRYGETPLLQSSRKGTPGQISHLQTLARGTFLRLRQLARTQDFEETTVHLEFRQGKVLGVL